MAYLSVLSPGNWFLDIFAENCFRQFFGIWESEISTVFDDMDLRWPLRGGWMGPVQWANRTPSLASPQGCYVMLACFSAQLLGMPAQILGMHAKVSRGSAFLRRLADTSTTCWRSKQRILSTAEMGGSSPFKGINRKKLPKNRPKKIENKLP